MSTVTPPSVQPAATVGLSKGEPGPVAQMSSDEAHDTPKTLKPNRIKSLDGLRAVAISLVLYAHAVNYPGVTVPWLDSTYYGESLRRTGRYGVLIFFVLSGYLITTLLLNEQVKTGSISLARFWYRRAFRILPVSVAFILTVGAISSCGVLDIRPSAFLAAVTYTWNYRFLFMDYQNAGADSPVLGHLWSLSVEEQFYLFFPLLLVLWKPQKVFGLCLALIITTPAIRVAQYILFPTVRDFGTIMGHTMFGVSVAFGCLLAIAEHLHIANRTRSVLSCSLAFSCAIGFIFVAHPLLELKYQGRWSLPLGETLAGLSAMVIVAYAVRHADDSWAGRLLNWRPIAYVGVLSYSIYIWQQLIYHFNIDGVPLLLSRVILTAFVLLVASVSYHLLEQPMLQFRERADRGLFKTETATLSAGIDLPQQLLAQEERPCHHLRELQGDKHPF